MFRPDHNISAHLERVDAVAAAHALLHPALVIEARAVSGELLGGDLCGRTDWSVTRLNVGTFLPRDVCWWLRSYLVVGEGLLQ